MASLLQDSMDIPTVRPRRVKTAPGVKTLVKTVELLMACPSDGLPAEVMKLVEAVEQQTAAMEQQKEAVEKQTAALLLAQVSFSLPLSLQEVAALARREEELARLVGQNKEVSIRMESRFIIEGTTGAVEEAKAIFRNFVEDSLNSGRSHEEELMLARGSRNVEMFGPKEACGCNVLLPTGRKECSIQRITTDETEASLETDKVLSKTVTKYEDLLVTSSEACALLVNRAKIIKKIQMDSAASIYFEAPCNRMNRRVNISGSEKAIRSAKLKIKEAI